MKLMKPALRLALIASFTLMALAATVPAKAQLLPVYGTKTFIKGANLPWLDGNYNQYLGIDPHHPDWGTSYNSASMNAHLADMHTMGINVVRLWIFQDDMGCTLDGSGNVTGVTPLFWTNLDDTVRLAGSNNIALYITLNNGRSDFLMNPTMLNAFLNNALKPLILRYKGDQRVFAIDAMNEIDGVVGGPDGNYGTGATWPEAQSYMRTVVATVHSVDPTRLVSCSSGWHAWYNLDEYFTGQNLDFYDFHQYDDSGYVPPASSFALDKPLYMGECGQSSSTWSDAVQNTAEVNFLSNAAGYAGVGIWAYQYPGAGDYHQMLNTDGSWRAVCYTIQNYQQPAAGPGPIPTGTYKIINRNSGRALDVYHRAIGNGSVVDQYAYNGGSNQRWAVTSLGGGQYSIVNVNAGKPLEVPSFGSTGTWTDLSDPTGEYNQSWTLIPTSSGYYRITPSYHIDLALDVYYACTGNYTPPSTKGQIDVYGWTGGTNQQWAFLAP